MTKKTFNLVLVAITIISVLAALALTSMSIEISKNKASSQAKNELIGTWTDATNPQSIIQFTDTDEYRVMGEPQATFQVDPNNQIITLSYKEADGERTEYYSYAFDSSHTHLTLTNVDNGQVVVYIR